MSNLLTFTETARSLSISVRTLERWVKDGKISTINIEGMKRISENELARFIRSQNPGVSIPMDFVSAGLARHGLS